MPVNPFTNDFMRALPAALRPNPHAIDDAVMEAAGNGWAMQDLAEACYANDRNPNPAFVVTNVRNLCRYPPTRTTRKSGWEYGHIVCDRHPNCEICRCIPNQMTHHTRSDPSVP